ncbi:hypothetical protein PUN28_004613 [Cardiocondyla obscurior]|uniref:Reverse transcriptase n=1 Tax=Cardiocondyla obscurior TaxID=286306 RepID=A0AAW2GBP2_9HYME
MIMRLKEKSFQEARRVKARKCRAKYDLTLRQDFKWNTCFIKKLETTYRLSQLRPGWEKAFVDSISNRCRRIESNWIPVY